MSIKVRNWIMRFGIIVALGFLIALVALLVFLYFSEPKSDKLGAIAAIFGGVVGASGAALAVYLTLVGQRSDEAEKVESTLRMETAELGRLAYGRLQVCEEILANRVPIPVAHLESIMWMPEAVVYKATADRISRLPYGQLFVVFHARIAEATSLAAVLAAQAGPESFHGRPLPASTVTAENATLMLAAWSDVCDIARSILRPGPESHQLAATSILACLADLDEAHARVAPAVKAV
jgi:hypothetical protein